MDITKLEVGKKFRNYKDMCEQLDLDIKKSTNSKKAQFKEIERYCKLVKDGQKIIIKEVYDTVHDKVDKRGATPIYRELVQLLITDLLAQSKGHISISKSKLMNAIGLVNVNYNNCREQVPKLSKYTELDKKVIYDFYDTSTSSLRWIIDSSLDNLMDKRVIMYKKIVKVAEKEDKEDYKYTTREAFDEEIEAIMSIEKQVLNEFGYDQISHIRVSKYWTSFRSKTQRLAKYELGIEFYFNAYDIIINNEYIVEERNKLASLLLEKIKRTESQGELNKIVYNNLVENAQKRHEKGFTNGKKAKVRMDREYVDSIKQLADLLIDIECPSIIHQLEQIKNSVGLSQTVEEEMNRLFG